MALFWPGTPCALCSAPIEEARQAIGFAALPTTPSAFDGLHDANVHRTCLRVWALKDEFVAHYNGLVDTRARGRVSRLSLTSAGDVVHEVDDWVPF